MEGFEYIEEEIDTGSQIAKVKRLVLTEQKQKEIDQVSIDRKARIEEFKSKAFNSVPFNITNVMLGRALIDILEEIKELRR